MSLREKVRQLKLGESGESTHRLYSEYGFVENPFPSSSQTSENPHYTIQKEADEEAERQIFAFIRDNRSHALVVQGTQGVGKTNFLNHFQSEIMNVADDITGYYVVRYFADPESSFDGIIHRIFQELGTRHLAKLAKKIGDDDTHIMYARSHDLQTALRRLNKFISDPNLADDAKMYVCNLMLNWLLGQRLLKAHKEHLGVQFRLDTVESKTSALRDIVEVSRSVGILQGVFLLLDELEKQDGVLSARAVVRYLSSIRAIIDALPKGLFLMIAVTPDALRRYSAALPALRSRLQNSIELSPLTEVNRAVNLAKFYIDTARGNAEKHSQHDKGGSTELLTEHQIRECYNELNRLAERRGDIGVRQREFLHELYILAEAAMSATP